MRFTQATLALAFTGLAAAQLEALNGLTSSCSNSIVSLISTDLATCLNLINLATSVFGANGSIVQPLDSYLGSTCPKSPCSAATINNASSTISTGCASDISSGQTIPTALQVLVGQYTGLREFLCLQAKSNSTYCLTNVLTAAQTSSGTEFTFSNLDKLLLAGGGGGAGIVNFLADLDASAVCTDCGAGLANVGLSVAANVSSSDANTAEQAIDSKCGSGFADSIPSTVSSSTTASGGNSGSGAAGLSMSSSLVFGSMFALFAAGFAVLA